MIPKTAQKLKAIDLRKKGLSYSEIQKYVQVSQSSLSLWLSNIKLSREQKDRLDRKGDGPRKLGSIALKNQRIKRTSEIIKKASSEIENLSLKELMLIGITLYWAEGNKQKEHNPSVEVVFSNSDPKMIQIYLKWVKECLNIPSERLVFEIYIHKSYKRSPQSLRSYWSTITGFPSSMFKKIYFKKNKIHSFRKNMGLDYAGVLRIKIRKSTDLNRQIMGWTKGICLRCGVATQNEL